jgi:hypothetical protein
MSKYDLEMADVMYIVERYQERAFDNNPAMGAMAVFAGNIESLRQLLEIGDEAFSISNYVDPTEQVIDSLGGIEPCSGDIVEGATNFPFPKDKALGDSSPKVSDFPTEKPAPPEDKDRFAQKCFECGDAPEWDVKWPVFGLEGLETLMDSINNCIDDLMKQLDPYNFLNGLCPFLDKFAQAQCELDLRALIALMNMLLARYSLSCLKLSLNWGVLIGPLIKAIVDFIANAIEYVIAYVSYIFDCMRNALQVIKNIFAQAQQLLAQTQQLMNQFADSGSAMFGKDNLHEFLKEPGAKYGGNNRGAGQFADESKKLVNNVGKQFGNGAGSVVTEPINYNFGGFRKDPKGARSLEGLGDGLLGLLDPNGISYNYNRPTLETMFDADERKRKEKQNEAWINRQMDKGEYGLQRVVDFISKMEAILNSGEDYIKELFASFLFSIKSLNSAINANVELNIKLGGIVLLLVDMMNLVNALVKTDFGNLCEDLEEGDFSIFEEMMKALYGAENLNFQAYDGRVRIDSDIYDINSITCFEKEIEADRIRRERLAKE